jgi:hypothetical protein
VFDRPEVEFEGEPVKTGCRASLLHLSQKSVDSFDKGCIMARVEDGADAQTSAGRKTSHLRPELR